MNIETPGLYFSTPPTRTQGYRCTCGKLLFKGILLLSIVKIKCERCGRISQIREISQHITGSSACAVLFDEHGVIVNIGKTAPELLGYSPEELIGMDVFTLNPTTSPALFARLWSERHDDGMDFYATIFYRHKSRGLLPARVGMKFLKLGEDTYLFVVADVKAKVVRDMLGVPLPPWIGTGTDEIYLEVDQNGKCSTRDARNVGIILGLTTERLGRMSIFDLCPIINKEDFMTAAAVGEAFEVVGNVFAHADDRPLEADSYFVPSFEGGLFCGYWVCSWLRSAVS